jgi:hypothetical protein
MRLGWIMMKSILLNLWIWSSRKHTQVHYAHTGRIAFLANGVTDIRPPRGPDVKRAWPDLRFVSDPKIKKYIWPQPHWFQPGSKSRFQRGPMSVTVLPTLGPQRRQTSKGHGRTSVLFRTPKSKNTYGPSHIGFNLGQNPDSIGLLAPAGPNVGSTSKPTHNSGPIGA